MVAEVGSGAKEGFGSGCSRFFITLFTNGMLILESSLLIGGIVFSYAVSSLVKNDAKAASYIRHPLWLDIPTSFVKAIVVLQIIALISYLVWISYLDTHRPEKGILASQGWIHSLNLSFLLSQALWPHLVKPFMNKPNLTNSLLASLPLWLSAFSVSVLTYGTFEAYNRILPLIVSVLVCVVVVLLDGFGWTTRSIFRSL